MLLSELLTDFIYNEGSDAAAQAGAAAPSRHRIRRLKLRAGRARNTDDRGARWWSEALPPHAEVPREQRFATWRFYYKVVTDEVSSSDLDLQSRFGPQAHLPPKEG